MHMDAKFNQCNWGMFRQTAVQRVAEMLNERENKRLFGKQDGHSKAVSHAQKLELTPAPDSLTASGM